MIDQAKFTSGESTKKAAVFLQGMKHEEQGQFLHNNTAAFVSEHL